MRFLQIIDSLEAGGAERMSVNIANLLAIKGHESILVVTRNSGKMAKFLNSRVQLVVLGKRHSVDFRAFKKLLDLVKTHQPDVVHVHATSAFWGAGLKVFSKHPFRLFWHDHYGESEELDQRDPKLLKWISAQFDGVLAVNDDLKKWARNTLSFPKEKVVFLRNFPMLQPNNSPKNELFTIIQVANLRPQKDHQTALEAFALLKNEGKTFQVYWAGNLSEEDHVQELENSIQELGLEETVHILGEVSFIGEYLQKSNLGLLTSRSEGLPVALLEYGAAGLPVVCTDVGQCSEVVKSSDYGILLPPNSPEQIAEGINYYMENPEEAKKAGENLRRVVTQDFGAEIFYEDYMKFIGNFTGQKL